MFAIASAQRQYQTYILTDESHQSQVEVVPSRGGIVTSWQINHQGRDHEIFYLDRERFSHPDLSVRGGIPILFPICGNLPDNSYTYGGQTYTLKQHGFARDLPWQVTDQSTQTSASLTITLHSNEQTLVTYPFDFRVDFTYELQGNTLAIRQKYTNLANSPMPFSAGLHPYFSTNAANKSQLQLDLPSSEFTDKAQVSYPFTGTFDFDSDEIDVVFLQLSRSSASVADPNRQLRITLDYDHHHKALVFWTVKEKDFYCLEPWTAPRNAMNTGENLIVLEAGASLEAIAKITATFVDLPSN